jgi:hypothetical protein
MKRQQHDTDMQVSGLELDRRGFLTGVSVALGALPLQALAAGDSSVAALATVKGKPRRAIHQQLAYIDHDGIGEVWDAPRGNQSTRDYVNSLTQEAFLRRHWFT